VNVRTSRPRPGARSGKDSVGRPDGGERGKRRRGGKGNRRDTKSKTPTPTDCALVFKEKILQKSTGRGTKEDEITHRGRKRRGTGPAPDAFGNSYHRDERFEGTEEGGKVGSGGGWKSLQVVDL